MQRSFIKGCCSICDRYAMHMKATRNGHRKYKAIQNSLRRKFRREMSQRLRNGNYEPVFLSEERWF